MTDCSGWQAANPICQVGGALGTAGGAVAGEAFAAIAHSFAGVADSAVSWLWHQLDVATTVELTSRGVRTDLVATGAIAALVTLALFLIQVLASALRHDPGGLARGLRGMAVAFLGAAFAVASTQVLLAAVDSLSNGVVQFALGTDINGLGARLVAADTLARIGNPAGLMLMSCALIVAVVIIWVALMIRKMLIIVAAVFAPFAFSGSASDISRSWVRRWLEFTVALVVSKLILVMIFMIGLTMLNTADQPGPAATAGARGAGPAAGHGTPEMTNLAIGALTLMLAGFAPWIAIKMVHFAGDSFHLLHAQAGSVTAGAQAVVATPRKIADAAPAMPPSHPGSGPGLPGRPAGQVSAAPRRAEGPWSTPGSAGAGTRRGDTGGDASVEPRPGADTGGPTGSAAMAPGRTPDHPLGTGSREAE